MTRTTHKILVLGALIAVLGLVGCSDDSNPTNPLSEYEPEIVNNQNDFQFQVTDIQAVSTALSYTWDNTDIGAVIDHSSAITEGTAEISIYDENGDLVYSSGLLASGNGETQVGVPGKWRIQVVLENASGTLNFRVQSTGAVQ